MKSTTNCSLLAMLLGTVFAATLAAQSSAITYQGRLITNGIPADGSYDMRFSLYSAASAGTLLAGPLTRSPVVVGAGLFSVELDFGAPVFDGSARWLGIEVRPLGSIAAYQVLAPRQPITSTPYAVRASAATTVTGSVTAGQLTGTINPVNIAPGSITGAMLAANTGSTLTGLNATQLTSGTVPSAALANAWRLNGNGGTSGGLDFLGTTDDQPLEFKVNNQRGLRLEYAQAGVETNINLIGGYQGNLVGFGVVGATISGGGTAGAENIVEGDFGTVGGGRSNSATVTGATTGGGIFNSATHYGATVSGGDFNTASGERSTVGGGIFNTADQYGATVGGGGDNVASGFTATIGGGNVNAATGSYAVVGGGFFNSATELGATVGGGQRNQSVGEYGTVPGGYENVATNWSLAAGYRAKAMHSGSLVWADHTEVDFSSTSSNQFLIRASGGVGIGTSAPAGSLHTRGSGSLSTAVFERNGVLSNTSASAARLRVTRTGDMGDGFAGGLTFELADDTNLANAGFIGAQRNGGSDNTTALIFQTANGGEPTTKMTLDRLGNLTTTGAVNPPSDRHVKQDFQAADSLTVLDKVVGMQIHTWAYTNDATIRHIGPVAQDFHAAFGLGSDDKHIATVDADGVALSAIQGLNRKLEAQVQQKQAEIAELNARLAELERIVARLGASRE